MVNGFNSLYNEHNTLNARIINLSGFDILFSPYGSHGEVMIKYIHIPQLVDDIEAFYLDIGGAIVPVCDRLCVTPLDEVDGTFYIVRERIKKAYKHRSDVLTFASENFDRNGNLIVRRLFS